MAMSPDDLRNKTFSIVKKGYERGEVHRFLGSVADELQAFNAATRTDEEIVIADVVEESEPEVDAGVEQSLELDEAVAPDDGASDTDDDAGGGEESKTSGTVEPVKFQSSGSLDDFDRMGNEISLMLRQAQESAFKIRSDAEVEARTLVDQVRLDIESDRLAHEQAAAELITRTEERASAMRTEAEEYATTTRESADTYAAQVREEADRLRDEASASVEADRNAAEAARKNAEEEAEATIAAAKASADEVREKAEIEAEARAAEIVRDAEAALESMNEAEAGSRKNLEQARELIETALGKLADDD